MLIQRLLVVSLGSILIQIACGYRAAELLPSHEATAELLAEALAK